MINLNRCPFLRHAVEFIAAHPGCCKAQNVRAYGGRCPARTYSYRNAAIGRLIRAKMVVDSSMALNRYSLYLPTAQVTTGLSGVTVDNPFAHAANN